MNYSTTENECLAVLYTIEKFRPYLYGRKFTLMSDHTPLKWIGLVKDPGQRLIRKIIIMVMFHSPVLYNNRI